MSLIRTDMVRSRSYEDAGSGVESFSSVGTQFYRMMI